MMACIIFHLDYECYCKTSVKFKLMCNSVIYVALSIVAFLHRLHMLQELEEYIIALMSSKREHLLHHCMDSWKARFSLTQVCIL